MPKVECRVHNTNERKPMNTTRLTLSEIQPKMRVAYVPVPAQWDKNAIEKGTVSSKNDECVFVKFDKQLLKFGWNGTTSQSCNPNDLVAI